MTDKVKSNAELLKEAQELNQEMAAELERIGEAGLEVTTVIALTDEHAILANGIYAVNNDYHIGQNVLIYPRTGQVVKAIGDTPLIGELFVIDKVRNDGTAELLIKGDRKLVSLGYFTDLKEGDVVLLDAHQKIVRALIERPNKTPKVEKPVTWDMIGGNVEAKQLLIEAIELPRTYSNYYAAYGQQNSKGILLYGPPGCGKTLLGKASATSIGTPEGFIPIKGPEVLDPYVGVSEANVRSVFNRAKAFKQRSGFPAVIFVDEAEALLTKRGQQHNFSGQTIVPTFLAEMDGVDESSAIVILCTNRDDMLDPAIIREGRVDFKVEVARPSAKDSFEIMAIHLAGKPVKHNVESAELIDFAVSKLYQHPKLPFSGALIEGCVKKAVTHALRRDIGTQQITGLAHPDFDWAVEQLVKQELKHAA